MHLLRSAAVQYTNYGSGGAFELPTQSGTLPNMTSHFAIVDKVHTILLLVVHVYYLYE